MRIATWNILSGRSPGEDRVDEARFAAAVGELDADLLGLQEVDRNQPRSQHADLTAVAAEAMGALDHQFVAALSGTPGATWAAATGEDHPEAAAYGIAFLSRHPVTDWRVVRLPQAPTRVPYRFHGRRLPSWVRDEPRVAVAARVEAPGGPLTVVTTHLSFLPLWNGHQLRLLLRSVADLPDPLVLLGDLNMPPPPAHRISGMRPLAAGNTFPVERPEHQIDHVLVRGSLTATGGSTVPLPVSDHRALVTELEAG